MTTDLPTIKWKCNSDDDFVGECNGYVFRVEVMDKNYVWWCIYYPDDHPDQSGIYLEYDFPKAKTIEQAVDYATSAFYFYYIEEH